MYNKDAGRDKPNEPPDQRPLCHHYIEDGTVTIFEELTDGGHWITIDEPHAIEVNL